MPDPERPFRELLLSLAEVRSMPALLAHIVDRLAERPEVALARVWLIEPGDLCDECPHRDECPTQVPCLHLRASAGTSRDSKADWSRTDGSFRRFPIGVRKIGRVGEGETLAVEDIEKDARWIADPEWAAGEGIRGFGGAPLKFRGEVLGALGIFTRTPFVEETLDWLSMIADHAAASIANARAFEEIERLKGELELENEYLREEISEVKPCGDIVGSSPALHSICERVSLVAPTDATVLIQGESGTGKELFARQIHARSERSKGPMIEVNCAAIPEDLYESEFFGHVRGAFTGASQERAGRFEAANGGTLFLDEVGEIPLAMQSKLLRALQERTVERVGEERTRNVDVRIVAATNRDLRAEVAAGRFREDLYYRLDVFPISVPPLRERRGDVVEIAEHFLRIYAQRSGRKPPRLTPASKRSLTAYSWPGNVRELQNVIERAVITWRGGPLNIDCEAAPVVMEGDAGSGARRSGSNLARVGGRAAEAEGGGAELMTAAQLRAIEHENLLRVLRHTRWKISGEGGAAELLGLRPTTLSSKLRKFGIERPS